MRKRMDKQRKKEEQQLQNPFLDLTERQRKSKRFSRRDTVPVPAPRLSPGDHSTALFEETGCSARYHHLTGGERCRHKHTATEDNSHLARTKFRLDCIEILCLVMISKQRHSPGSLLTAFHSVEVMLPGAVV
ncbi:putative IQ motif and ankyrin repeat domain-containing protein LOC642574 homolog isoform X1 [Lates japonicus]|uniref:IQ motif and ankyrin repeat domain-containing protein LOC642574 homolog isoform X1 n=1 Tax=Lates japonicus TaxID=270547 RepID=A0AAD3ML13_LATJO|nr:putative IQ motif and ankyrin repeat domain-containing protein LOC642574 homolog isoform X1 [Lates japonicus]